MKTKSKLTLLNVVLVLFSVNQGICAQTDLSQKTDLSETEKQLSYSRGFETILWASLALVIITMYEAAKRDLGAGNSNIILPINL